MIKMKNPNAFPIGKKFGFFIFGGDCWTRTSDLLRVKIRCAPESVASQRFPAFLHTFGSVGDPLCPPVSTCFFPRLGHGLGQAPRRRRNDHAVTKEWACRLSTPFKIVKSCGRAPIGEASRSPLCRRQRIIRPPQLPHWYTPCVSRSLPEMSA